MLKDRIRYSRWNLALWIVFGSSRIGEENRQEDFNLGVSA